MEKSAPDLKNPMDLQPAEPTMIERFFSANTPSVFL